MIAATLLSEALPLRRVLVWNATASLPTGLYYLGDPDRLRVGERVAIEPPPGLRDYLAGRGYLPSGVPLLKEVAALDGDIVCRTGLVVTINGKSAGHARAADSSDRPLPAWEGCRRLGRGEVFAMNTRSQASFDGRYFGPISRACIIGRARPVWTDEAGGGAHAWFARATIPDPSTRSQGDGK